MFEVDKLHPTHDVTRHFQILMRKLYYFSLIVSVLFSKPDFLTLFEKKNLPTRIVSFFKKIFPVFNADFLSSFFFSSHALSLLSNEVERFEKLVKESETEILFTVLHFLNHKRYESVRGSRLCLSLFAVIESFSPADKPLFDCIDRFTKHSWGFASQFTVDLWFLPGSCRRRY